jgi:hypothetical protein
MELATILGQESASNNQALRIESQHSYNT